MSAFWIGRDLVENEPLRDRLYEKISRGGRYRKGAPHIAWSSERGEQVAKRLGLRPFETKPDPAKFDPMRERYWTLSMAIAWIVWRDVNRVREAWPTYCAQCFEWGPWYGSNGRREIEQKLPLTLERIEQFAQGSATYHCTPTNAQNLLLDALSTGALKAFGLDVRNERAEISTMQWMDLRLATVKSDACKTDVASSTHHPHAVVFTDIRFSSDDIVNKFILSTLIDNEDRKELKIKSEQRPVFQKTIKAARVALTEYLKSLPDADTLTRAAARDFLSRGGFVVGSYQFYGVWKDAREAAGLTGKARSGRKPNPAH